MPDTKVSEYPAFYFEQIETKRYFEQIETKRLTNITQTIIINTNKFKHKLEQHQHRKIACLEEIAYLNGWISKEELMEVYEVMKKNQYGQYLKDVMDGKYQEHLF